MHTHTQIQVALFSRILYKTSVPSIQSSNQTMCVLNRAPRRGTPPSYPPPRHRYENYTARWQQEDNILDPDRWWLIRIRSTVRPWLIIINIVCTYILSQNALFLFPSFYSTRNIFWEGRTRFLFNRIFRERQITGNDSPLRFFKTQRQKQNVKYPRSKSLVQRSLAELRWFFCPPRVPF